jgi:2-polyprenyl-3-methyl-5-hydroxy-6-metoxy-1,4-benzoquinol methylase
MRLPLETELTNATAHSLYQWDRREYFAVDTKNYWTIHYRNRLETILRAMSDFVPAGGSILDIGCAQATASLLLAERGFKVTAVDANPESLQYAKLRYEFGDITFLCMDAMTLSLKGEFDAILLGEIVEHVPRPSVLVKECRDRLRRGGIICITTPNGLSLHNWLIPRYDPSMEETNRMNTSSGLGGRETHLFNFRPSQLRHLVLEAGLVIERWGFLNSYAVNPIGIHRVLPKQVAESINRLFSRLPVLCYYATMTLFIVARKP